LGTDFDWTVFFAAENRCNMRMLQYETTQSSSQPHIVNRQFGVKNRYVWFWGPHMRRSRDTAHAQ